MRSNPHIWLILISTAINHIASIHGYVLYECEPYADDIANAVVDFTDSAVAADAAVTVQQERVIDWTGLLDTLYPGLRTGPGLEDQWQLLTEMLAYAQMFDDTEYDSVHNAMIPELITWTADHDLPPEVKRLDSATMFICDPTKFVKVDPTTANPQWYEPESGELFIITTESEICPAGLKSRLALHAGPPKYYVIILCPPAVTQTPGQPKMYGTLDGRPLANSRPDSYILPITPLTTEITMNLQVWAGMKIDQLRDRTLSVYIGRYILHIQAQKYISSLANIAGSRISIMSGYESFDRATTMGLFGGLMNVDSYSLFITGARMSFDEVAGRRQPGSSQHRSLSVHRWNRQGYYYLNTDMNPDTVNDNADYYGSDWIG